MEMAKIKVLRGFYYNKELQPKDKIITLPRPMALEFVSMNKAEIVRDAPQSEPVKAEEPKPEKVSTKQKI